MIAVKPNSLLALLLGRKPDTIGAPLVRRDAAPAQLYRIWSLEHGRWWGPNAVGYVEPEWPTLAGAYTLEEATAIVRDANRHVRTQAPKEAIVPV